MFALMHLCSISIVINTLLFNRSDLIIKRLLFLAAALTGGERVHFEIEALVTVGCGILAAAA